MNTAQNPHDGLFKITFSNLEIVRDYLRNFLPKEISENLQFDSLELLPNSFVSPKLEAFYSDLIYKCRFGSKNLIISLLFEHKSSPQKYPHLQLLRYLVSLWEEQIKQKQSLLPIIPIIVYHGKKRWKQRDFAEYFGEELPANLRPYLPLFNYHLTDLSNWSDHALKALEMGLLYNTFLLMKHYGEADYIRRFIHRLFDFSKRYLLDEESRNLIHAFFVYLFTTTNLDKKEYADLFIDFEKEIKSEAMTTYEQLILEGKKTKEIQVIKAAFLEGIPIETIAKIVNLSLQDLKLRLVELGLIQK